MELKVAPTVFAPPIVTWQVRAVPEHAPDQPRNAPSDGCAVSVTSVPSANVAERTRFPVIMIPAGLLVTEPHPVVVTSSVQIGPTGMKRAVTVWLLFTVTVHVPRPEQGPAQPLNTDEPSGVAVRVTTVPGAKPAVEQVDPQSIPGGLETTVPPPWPLLKAVRVELKVAPTVFAPSIVTWQVRAVPEHAPDQPRNAPSDGAAVSVTTVPAVNVAERTRFPVIMIPLGLLVTEPHPFVVTSSEKVFLPKVALTDLATSMVTTHVPEVQPPPSTR